MWNAKHAKGRESSLHRATVGHGTHGQNTIVTSATASGKSSVTEAKAAEAKAVILARFHAMEAHDDGVAMRELEAIERGESPTDGRLPRYDTAYYQALCELCGVEPRSAA